MKPIETMGHIIATGLIAIFVLWKAQGLMSWSHAFGAFTIGAMLETMFLMGIYILQDHGGKK